MESLFDGAGLGLLGIFVLDRATTAYFSRYTDPTALSRSCIETVTGHGGTSISSLLIEGNYTEGKK